MDSKEDDTENIENDVLSRINNIETLIKVGIEQVLTQFEDKFKYDAFKEKQLDALHQELQDYKSDLLSQALRPIFNALIRLHDDTGKMLEGLRNKPAEELNPERFFNVMEDFADDIDRLLRDHGVNPFLDQEPGQQFNGQRQQAVGFINTSEAEENGCIAEQVRSGFEYGKIMLRKERVKVYRYVAEDVPTKTNDTAPHQVAEDIPTDNASDKVDESP